jgi:CBS domain-containing protein
MKHPKRAITRDVRTRKAKRPDRVRRELGEQAWPEGIRASDFMTRPVVTFRQEMRVGAAAKAMRARRIHHAPVVDDRGRLTGIVTDRDLRPVVPQPGVREATEDVSEALAVRDVMTWGVVTVSPAASLRQVAHLMRTNRIGAVPVVERDRAVGMLTASDVLGILIQILDEGVIARPGRWGAEG